MSARLFMAKLEKLARAGCAVQLFGAWQRGRTPPRTRFNRWMQTFDQILMASGPDWLYARFAHR